MKYVICLLCLSQVQQPSCYLNVLFGAPLHLLERLRSYTPSENHQLAVSLQSVASGSAPKNFLASINVTHFNLASILAGAAACALLAGPIPCFAVIILEPGL